MKSACFLLLPCALSVGCSSSGTSSSSGTEPPDGSPGGTNVATATPSTACADCRALPVAGGPDAPTIVSAVLKPTSGSGKSFYEFTITDPQGDVTNLQIGEFSGADGKTLLESNNFSCSSDSRADCTVSGSSFTLYLQMANAAAIRAEKTWPLQLVVTDARGHSTSAKVNANVLAGR